MEALLWRDYLCPWCGLGRGTAQVLVDLGLTVTHLPFDLHPEVRSEGRAVRPGGRLDAVFDRIEAECERDGIAFTRPTRTPNTRRALETAEIVRRVAPASFPALDDALFRGHWVDGLDIGDPAVLDELVQAAGAPLDVVADARADGLGSAAIEESMATARAHGIAATPSWLIDGSLVIPGVQPAETIERWVTRLASRRAGPG
ncbi:MAG: DsbA family oxidoreductase [Acidimicrobiales bacterium]